MEKALFVLSHRETPVEPGWKLLQTGNSDKALSEYRANTGDNIHALHHMYLETTGIYWIWKNIQANIKGHCQVRRRLGIDVDSIEKILEDHDIILPSPCHFNVLSQYGRIHCVNDLLKCGEIINEPEQFGRIIEQGNTLYFSNSFICKSDLYDRICSFVFSVLDKFVKQNGFEDRLTLYEHIIKIKGTKNPHPELSMAQYQMRICGYLFERILTYYVLRNNLKIYDCGQYKSEPKWTT